MTTSAWIMLGITWAVITFFTVCFFVIILRRPKGGGG